MDVMPLALLLFRLQGQHEVAFIHDVKVFFDDLSTGESADLLRHLLSVRHVLPLSIVHIMVCL